MYSVRKAINYVFKNGKWKLHSFTFTDASGKGRPRKFPTIEAAEAFAFEQMDKEGYNDPGTMYYIAYCTIYQGKTKIKQIERESKKM